MCGPVHPDVTPCCVLLRFLFASACLSTTFLCRAYWYITSQDLSDHGHEVYMALHL